ncbi:MAG TPA: ceramide glucosyltransferase [Myxococcaceae bacterium]|nr:ceramide glucosyltransferase [Myxococcaceae bacterium]
MLLWLMVAAGFVALLLQAVVVRRYVKGRHATPGGSAGISVLKPLCGLDDGLAESLDAFARLAYPRYEILLGVRDADDAAYPLAQACARAHPDLVRLVLQRGEPGLNPKVNQLVTLAARARYPILVVSDSNVRVAPDYLDDVAAAFADPDVGCVTHPVAGAGHRTPGSLLDNLHLASGIGAAQIAAKCVSGRDLVVGKSMAMRKSDLDALGGFAAFKDYLAEDYVFGRRITTELGKRVVISRTPILNYSRRKTVGDFTRRYARWSVIHRTAIQPQTYLAQALINPLPLAALACLAQPAAAPLSALAALAGLKAAIDLSTASALAPGVFRARNAWAVWLKDGILFAAWVRGLTCRTILWRGNRLRVGAGSRLRPAYETRARLRARVA